MSNKPAEHVRKPRHADCDVSAGIDADRVSGTPASELHGSVELKPALRCGKPRTLLVLAGCAVWLAGLGWIDRATGYELGLFAFYTAPVAVVAWNLGQATGIIVAFIASAIWYMAGRYAGDHYSAPFYAYWNTGMHFITFIINAVTFAKIKSSLNQRHELERALAESREQVRQLAGLIPLRPLACSLPQQKPTS